VVYVYDVTKRSTFEDLEHWLDEYNSYSLNSEVPRILVGQ
jgi:GTPase SAR1 family protein